MTLIVIQARTGSTRLPGKILLPLAGATILERMVERIKASTLFTHLMIATTDLPEDDPIEALAKKIDVRCFRGHPTDLLDRHFKAAEAVQADVVVKIPSDCPLIDPAVIDRVLSYYHNHRDKYDFVSNLHPATYPDGNDVEVMPLAVLETAWKEATQPFHREHTTPFVWDQPERFRIGNVRWQRDLDYSMSHRFTVDYRADYDFIRTVYDKLWTPASIFSLDSILELLDKRPDIYQINAQHVGVNWYRHHLSQLHTIHHHETRVSDNE